MLTTRGYVFVGIIAAGTAAALLTASSAIFFPVVMPDIERLAIVDKREPKLERETAFGKAVWAMLLCCFRIDAKVNIAFHKLTVRAMAALANAGLLCSHAQPRNMFM